MKFSLWMENMNDEELSLLKNVISNVRDNMSMMVFADWLEEHGREESVWLREVANGTRKNLSRYIYNKYVNGLTIGMESRRLSPTEFIRVNSSSNARIDPELIKSVNQEWEEIMQLPNVSLSGSKVKKYLKNINYVIYYFTRDVWRVNVTANAESIHPYRMESIRYPYRIEIK